MKYAVLMLSLCVAAGGCGFGNDEMPEPAGGGRPTPTLPPLPPAVGPSPDYSQFERVPMIRLLATPTSMDKKAVSVVGYLSLPSNCIDCGTWLCFHKEDAENRLGPNCVGVDLPDSARRLDHRYVEVRGIVAVRRFHSTFVYIQDIAGVAPVANEQQWEADLWRK
jgi:hypothetical protein